MINDPYNKKYEPEFQIPRNANETHMFTNRRSYPATESNFLLSGNVNANFQKFEIL